VRPKPRRHARGQALVEFALIVPMLSLLALGTYDLGRSYAYSTGVVSQGRSGVRLGIRDPNSDIGNAIRNDSRGLVADAAWGPEAPRGTPGSLQPCDQSDPNPCGDPYGCLTPAQSAAQPGSTTPFTSASTLACFSVRTATCTNVVPSGCDAGSVNYGTWGSRPTADPVLLAAPVALDVKVVYRFAPATPMISALVSRPGDGNYLYISRETLAFPTY